MKTTLLKLKYFLIASIVILTISCSAEDGEDGINGMDGAPGIQGEQGLAGQDGADGQDGTDGQDGQDGVDGEDGQDGTDGNANVNAYTFDISGVEGSLYGQNIPELTQSVLDNDVVLGYVKRNNNWFQLPAIGHFLPFSIATDMTPGFYFLNFVNLADGGNFTITAGALDLLKVVVIESNSNTTSKNGHPDFSKMTYFEVMDYLGLEY
ncbi:MAG: hypothetical protein AAF554_05950 [Bacteroidota bacterium]